MDFGAAAAKYLDAFVDNIRWAPGSPRLERAQRAGAILKH
jgi:hypothetical protein